MLKFMGRVQGGREGPQGFVKANVTPNNEIFSVANRQ